MKWFRRYPLLCVLFVSGLLLSLAGLWEKQGAYSDYTYNVVKMPLSALVFRGMHDGTLPFFAKGESGLDGECAPEEIKPLDDVGDVAQPDETVKTGEDTAENRAEERTEGNDRVEDGENLTYEFVPVDEEYFDDALFIGDSRTVGLYEYAGLEERAAFYCKTSLTIWDVLDKPIVKVEGQKKPVTIEEALSQKQFGKIYLMVGINELGRGDVDQFMEQYRKVVERIRQLQPDAIVFVEGIMRVAGEKDASDAIFNNTNINVRNEQIALLADNRDIFYIDVNEAVCDEEGNLRAEYTFDQIHLKAAYYEIWKEFLLQHGIVRTDKNP